MKSSRAQHSRHKISSLSAITHSISEDGFPEKYDSDPDVSTIVQLLTNDRTPLLIVGKAGTGKSTLIRYISKLSQFRNNAILAPTGMAALKVSGQTIHSFFRLPPRLLDDKAISFQRANRAWRHIDTIFIDEISMVRADVLDAMDTILRRERKNSSPFGNVRIVMVGDFFQLPPVANESDRQILGEMGYRSPFAFHSRAISQGLIRTYELTRVHRQSEQEFIDNLNALRTIEGVSDAVERLNEKCHRQHREGAKPILLTGSNAKAVSLNNRALSKLSTTQKTYSATFSGDIDFQAGAQIVPETLKLKPGARVIAMKNDPSRQWVNGSLGTVEKLLPDSVLVNFDSGRSAVEVRRMGWEKTRYTWNEATKSIQCEIVGTYTQIPLNLAWSITIHKAQGLSLDDVRVDLSDGAFASGQVYVALSRARSLSGLSFSSPIAESDVFFDYQVREFYRSIRSQSGLHSETDKRPAKTFESVMERLIIQYLIADRNNDSPLITKMNNALAARGLEIVKAGNGIHWRRLPKQ